MESAVYEIRLKNQLNPAWQEWFAGMKMEYDAMRQETVLTGNVADQAALYGMLMQARNLALTLVSVNRMEHKEQYENSNTK
jgi:hypothetical protein